MNGSTSIDDTANIDCMGACEEMGGLRDGTRSDVQKVLAGARAERKETDEQHKVCFNASRANDVTAPQPGLFVLSGAGHAEQDIVSKAGGGETGSRNRQHAQTG